MTVYYATALKEHFPEIWARMRRFLAKKNIVYSEIHSNNLWIRDWMPIRTVEGYTKFRYGLEERFPRFSIASSRWINYASNTSDIYLDGGNVEQNGTHVLMTTMVFKRNPKWTKKQLTLELERLFEKKIVFLPSEPGDDLGHIDGIARFVTPNAVFINNYAVMHQVAYTEYQHKLESILSKVGIETILFPYAYDKCPKVSEEEFRKQYPFADDFNPGVGYYINWYKMDDLIFLPTFGIDEDKDFEAFRVLATHFPDYTIIPINCYDLAMLGGLCNCSTWEYK